MPPKRPKPDGETNEVGGAGRDRTDDLYNAIVALSQLSYGPIQIKLTAIVREVLWY